MRKLLLVACLATFCLTTQASAQEAAPIPPAAAVVKSSALIPIELREKARAKGPALQLGDVFAIEGPAATKEIAPAPPPGEAGTYATAFLSAAARAAGYEWTPQAGFIQIAIEGPRRDEPQRPPSHFAQTQRGYANPLPTSAAATSQASAPFIKRGDQITLVYAQGPLRLSTKARALSGAAVGETLRVVTLPAEQHLEARVTGPGEASVSQ